MNQSPTKSTPALAWDNVRHTIACVRAAGRAYLFGQAWLGWQLATLKKQHDCTHGGNRKSSGQIGHLNAWSEIVEAETGLPRRTADRFISLYEATLAKLKRTAKLPSGKPAAESLALFQNENPLALPPEQREHLQCVVASLCDGETQASLMRELGVLPQPNLPPVGKKNRGEETRSPEQLAFDFFEAPASAIINARASRDYQKLLHCLPVTTTEPGKVSLILLRDEAAAMVEDIEKAIALHAKPARGH